MNNLTRRLAAGWPTRSRKYKPMMSHSFDRHPRVFSGGDTFFTDRPPLATLLSRHWLALGPGEFYGAAITLDPTDYPCLRRPGKYLVYGQYSWGGFHRNLQRFDDETAKLPFRAWERRTKTNSVGIEVLKPNEANRNCGWASSNLAERPASHNPLSFANCDELVCGNLRKSFGCSG